MTKILLSTIFSFFLINVSIAQLVIEEFDSPAGEGLLDHGYSSYLSGTINPVRIIEGNLTYPGYSDSGVGNMISIGALGQHVFYTYKTLDNEISSGTIYAAMLVSVDSAQLNGDFFFSFAPTNVDTSYRARTLIKLAQNGKIAFGLNKATTYAKITFSDSIYEIGETYLLVVGYKFEPGEGNDTVKLWINPEISGSEPTADIVVADSNRNNEDITVGTYIFRQGYDSLTAFLKLDQLRIDTVWSRTLVAVEETYSNPSSFTLEQNYPNPFNPATKIKYSIPVSETNSSSLPVVLKVYDVMGNEVVTLVNEEKSPGEYEIIFDVRNLASGTYFYQLRAGNFAETKKMLLLK